MSSRHAPGRQEAVGAVRAALSTLIRTGDATRAAAAALGVTEGKASDMMQVAGLDMIHMGMRHWYRRADFEAWLSRQRKAIAR